MSLKDRVLNQIENVRDWLDRAEDGYRNDAYLQGEMNLNLAQAELKKAWEESRRLNTGPQGEVIPFPPTVADSSMPRRGLRRLPLHSQHRYGLVAAVVLLLLLNVTPLLQLARNEQSSVPHTQDIQWEEPADEQGSGVLNPVQMSVDESQSPLAEPVMLTAQMPEGKAGAQDSVKRTLDPETSLRFHVTTDPLVYIPEKEVKPESAATIQAEVKLEKSFALQSRQLSAVGKGADKWPLSPSSTADNVSTQVALSKTSPSSVAVPVSTLTTKGAVVQYDVDQLVNLAKETLTSKR